MAYYAWKHVRDQMIDAGFLPQENWERRADEIMQEKHGRKFKWTGDYDCDWHYIVEEFINTLRR